MLLLVTASSVITEKKILQLNIAWLCCYNFLSLMVFYLGEGPGSLPPSSLATLMTFVLLVKMILMHRKPVYVSPLTRRYCNAIDWYFSTQNCSIGSGKRWRIILLRLDTVKVIVFRKGFTAQLTVPISKWIIFKNDSSIILRTKTG